MPNILGYYVFDQNRGGWLQDDEKTWGSDFYCSVSFQDAELANSIGERECPEGGFYIFACMSSM